MSLTVAQKKIITASVPFLEEHAVELTSTFYARMLANNPDVRPFFNKSHQITKKQPKILAYSLVQYAKNIDDLTPLLGFVEQIVEKHVGLQVVPEQYAVVGTNLLATLKEMLGDAATDDFMKAWEVAYWDLANILIDLEKKRYAEVKGWLGFKPFTVTKMENENDTVMSVYVKPTDSALSLPKYEPGQYITLRFTLPDGTVTSREYSLSQEWTESPQEFRISVRRIEQGVVSNFVHDHLKQGASLQVTAPYGKLWRGLEGKKIDDAVFFIAGIGITPAISLADRLLAAGSNVRFLYSNATPERRAFENWLESRLAKNTNLEVHEFISHDQKPVVEGKHHFYDHSLNDLKFLGDLSKSELFLLGPTPYREAVLKMLASEGVDTNKVRSEQFAPLAV